MGRYDYLTVTSSEFFLMSIPLLILTSSLQQLFIIIIIFITFQTVNPQLGEPDAKNPKAPTGKTTQ